MIDVSIIIPVRNQLSSLAIALDSLKGQIKKPRQFEIVISDDGSSDGTGETLKRLRYPIFFKYLYNNQPLGRAANRNQGAAKASGKILIFFDGDMVPDRGYIDSMLADFSPATVKTGNVKPPPDSTVNSLEKYLYSRGRHEFGEDSRNLPGRYFTSNNFCIDRELFKKTDGFDTNFTGWGGEDIDFGLRLIQLGASIKNEPKAITYHYHKRTVDSLSEDFYSFGTNSFEYLIKKHPYFLKQLPSRKLGIIGPDEKIGLFDKAVSRIFINSIFLKFARIMIGRAPKFAWPDIAFDFILWGNLAQGYRNRKIIS